MTPAACLSWPQELPPVDERLRCVLCYEATDWWALRWAEEIAADGEVAELLQEAFACTVLDVDLRPGLAAQVQEILGMTAGAQGWPALAFALPDGRWLGAVPYAPVRDAHKRTGVARMAVELLQAWQSDEVAVTADAERLQEMRWQLARPPVTDLPPLPRAADQVEAIAMAAADTLEGGFGSPPHLLNPGLYDFLLERCAAPDAPSALRQQVAKSFQAAIAGGLQDHIAGGFFRAVTDAHWSVPFFDKRTIDQAQRLLLFRRAAAVFASEAYAAVADRCQAWLLGGLQLPSGALAQGLQAGSPGADGRMLAGAAYVWHVDAVADLVGEEAADLFQHCFLADERSAIDPDQAFRLPVLRQPAGPAEQDRLVAICRRLEVARAERPQPERVERVLLRDQGMALLALAGTDDEQAVRVRRHLQEQASVWIAGGHAWRSADAQGGTATAEDLIWLARGLQADGADAMLIDDVLDRVLASRNAVGLVALSEGPALVLDPADRPAATAVLVDALRIAGRWDEARAVLAATATFLRDAPISCAGLVAAWLRLEGQSSPNNQFE